MIDKLKILFLFVVVLFTLFILWLIFPTGKANIVSFIPKTTSLVCYVNLDYHDSGMVRLIDSLEPVLVKKFGNFRTLFLHKLLRFSLAPVKVFVCFMYDSDKDKINQVVILKNEGLIKLSRLFQVIKNSKYTFTCVKDSVIISQKGQFKGTFLKGGIKFFTQDEQRLHPFYHLTDNDEILCYLDNSNKQFINFIGYIEKRLSFMLFTNPDAVFQANIKVNIISADSIEGQTCFRYISNTEAERGKEDILFFSNCLLRVCLANGISYTNTVYINENNVNLNFKFDGIKVVIKKFI